MGRAFSRLIAVVSTVALGSLALADEPKAPAKVQGAGEQAKQGIVAVTDAQGHPVDLRSNAAPPKPDVATRKVSGGPAVPVVQRGQAWWPYAEPLARDAATSRTPASLRENEIDVNGVVTIDISRPEAALQRLPKELVLDQGRQLAADSGFYLVKIRGVSRTQHEVDALQAAGAVLGEYLNINTYIAKIPAASVAAVRALPFVTYVGDYQPAYKLSPRLGLEEIPVTEAYDQATGRENPWVLEVVLHKGVTVDEVLNGLAGLSLFPDRSDVVENDALSLVFVRTAPEFIPMLSQIPGVKWIAEKTYPRLLATSTVPTVNPMILQNNGVFTTNKLTGWKLWNAGIDGDASGSAQIVTMMDTGLATSAFHFSQDTISHGTLGPAHRKVVGYDVFGGDQCVNNAVTADGGHGTETSQHAVGSISNMTSNPDTVHTPNENWDDGIARAGKVYFQDIGDAAGTLHPPIDLGPAVTAAIAKGSFIQNHSWGAASSTYDSQASLLDTAIFNNPNFIVTASAGNNGILGSSTIDDVCTAKNAICVGGADPSFPNRLFQSCTWDGAAGCTSADLGSSRGPVLTSGRVKPDIVAYMANFASVGGEFEAVNLSHAMCQTDATKTPYWDFVNNSGVGGTSFSAPETAGLAALVRDYFLAGFYPSGSPVPANAITPSGSLVKALILASGENMENVSWPDAFAMLQRYSPDVGFGRANLPAALHIGAGAPFLWVQNNDNLGDGSTKSFFYNINGNTVPLRVMMVYYDAAGNALQKDADLKVTIGANVYRGNNFVSGWSITGGVADHTNNTEGVFLDAAHGLPASGTVQVDIVGFNDPAGMNYSLVVVGDVASQAVTQVSFDSSKYSCNKTIGITVNDTAGVSPVSVTVTSRDASTAIIDTQVVSCAGSGGVFDGSIVAGSGLIVADGGTVTATYGAATPSVANIVCQAAVADGGFILSGGCDNTAAGTDQVSGPLTNSGQNEFYTRYMDAGENTAYTFGFVNQTGAPLTDVFVTLSFTGGGASKMTVLNNPVHVGAVPVDALTGAVFQVRTDNTAVGLSTVLMNFDVTSAPDGFTTAKRVTQVQLLQTNDVILRQNRCSAFTTLAAFQTWFEATVAGHATNPWKWSGSATAPSTVSSENRTDGICSSGTLNAAAMVGNSAITSGNNFTGNADSFLIQRFQPALLGNGPSGQPYHYAWKWHSFYHASETLNATTGVWGAFYNDQWNQPVNPTGDQAAAFPIALAYFYQTVFDFTGTWNWELSNTGTPDDPRLSSTTVPIAPPNQLFVTFNGVTGLANSNTWFAYGHEHADVTLFGGISSLTTRRDIALDNDNLVYDEFYAAAQPGASCGGGGQVGLVAFDRFAYNNCPQSQAIISVTDANAVSPLHVTVSSPGTGDSEVVTLTGSAPFFSGSVNLSTTTAGAVNDGTLLVLPVENITVSYTDTAPAGTSTASAQIGCTGGNVVLVSHTQVSDNGDNDGIPDNNETVTLDLTIQNNLATPLANTKVQLISHSANIDCVGDPQALYGTVAAGAAATNPIGDRFQFHVNAPVACSDWQAPPKAQFTVLITGDGINGASSLQTFSVDLDLDNQVGGSYNYSQNFASNPGWDVGVTPPDNAGCDANPYVNDFHWCAACGNAGGGYGAWVGNSAFGTAGQNYTAAYSNSTLYSPVFTANGNTTLQFQVAYRTETPYDGAIVQYALNGGAWTLLPFTTPVQAATTAGNFCSPIAASTVAWTGSATGTAWTTTNIASVPSGVGNSLQFRWRLGGDVSVNGTSYGGLGVDNVSVTNLQQTQVCEPTRNTGLPGCPLCASAPDGTACDDGNPCTQTDACSSGACVGSNPVPAPGDVGSTVAVNKTGTDANLAWSAASNSTTSDALRGNLSALPVGPGGGDETCFGGIIGTVVTDTAVPAPGTGFWYLIRGHNTCAGAGTYGNQGVNGSPGALRVSTTCP